MKRMLTQWLLVMIGIFATCGGWLILAPQCGSSKRSIIAVCLGFVGGYTATMAIAFNSLWPESSE